MLTQPQVYKYKSDYGEYFVRIDDKGQYANNRKALRLVDTHNGSAVLTATVDVPEEPLGQDELIIKDWSENAGILDFLQKNNVVSSPVRSVICGQKIGWVVKLLNN